MDDDNNGIKDTTKSDTQKAIQIYIYIDTHKILGDRILSQAESSES